MAKEKVRRKLASVLIADVKGYSRLMGEDEAWATRMLNNYKEVLVAIIQERQGRLVDSVGDNLLAEFGSALDAVKCAVEMQGELKVRNEALPGNRRMEFRMGVNLGDVVEEGDKISGDGVNVAAKLENIAAAGGVCISGAVYDYVKNKAGVKYEYLGEQSVKNIEKPVRAYRVLIEPKGFFSRLSVWKGAVVKQWERLNPVVKVIIAVAIAANALWQVYPRLFDSPLHDLWKGKMVSSSSDKAPKTAQPTTAEVASKDKMAFPLPDKPSIAVLPFLNMSEDPKQEYFSDGITEDLITDLSKISGLLVIARNSTFIYKGKPVKIKQVAEELSVRYVLEGSVRRAGDEIRINAQLIDAITGQHLWAERYDGTMGKIFALQDQVTQKIVSALAVKLAGTEKQTMAQKGTNNVEAYDDFLKGWGHYLRLTPTDFGKAAVSFKKAIELDPGYGRAYAALALLQWTASLNRALCAGLGIAARHAGMQSNEYLKKALKQPTSIAYNVSSQMYLQRRQHKEAISELERGLALDQNDPSCYQSMGYTLIMDGRPKEAIDYINKGMRLDPLNPSQYLYHLGLAHFSMGELTEAAVLLEKAERLNPENGRIAFDLAAFYGIMGRNQEAQITLNKVRKKAWGGTEVRLSDLMFNKPFKNRAVAERYAEGLLKAGMPGQPSGYFPTFKENQLTGEKIKALLFGSAITGISFYIGPWWIDCKKNGEFFWRGITRSDIGKIRVEGDMICIQYQERWWGLERCGTVFKNPLGTAERRNEYFFFGDSPMEFSPVR